MRNRVHHLLVRVSLAACLALAAGLPEAVAPSTVPRPSGEFAINTTDGKQILLSQYKGKVRALIFIITSCPHCQETVGYLSTMQQKYGPQGLQVLGSAIDAKAEIAVPDFIKRYSPGFPVGFNARHPVLDYLHHPYKFKLMTPQLVFIDRQGTIRAQYAGDDKFLVENQEKHLRDQIEALLKEGTAGHKKRSAAPKKASLP